jgi:hypothetical protein
MYFFMYKYRKLRNALLSPSIPCLLSLPQTCLQSYDAGTLHKSLFHMSMVHFNVPKTLDHWVRNKTGFEIGAPSLTTWGSLGV